jgi:hypothetical protein
MNYLPQAAACALILILSASNAAATQTAAASARGSASWPTDVTARLEATALLQSLNVEPLSNDNKKQTLERWCMSHRLVSNPQIAIERVLDVEELPTEAQRKTLATSAKQPVRHRKVRVLCGSAVLLEADDWYLPSRVSPQVSALIDGTDLPFETAVQIAHFRRRILSAALLWPQLPELGNVEFEEGVAEPQAIRPLPAHVLTHHVLVMLPDGTPFGEAQENYTGSVLAFPCPSLPEIVVIGRRPRAASREPVRVPM